MRSSVAILGLALEPVADAAKRDDLHCVTELCAQPRDVDVDRLRGEVRRSPRVLEQLLTREDAAGCLHESGEQIELAARQVDLAAADRAAPRFEIQFDLAGAQRRFLRRVALE